MTSACITSPKPADIAREVERLRNQGCRVFVISRVDGGGMLDLERLGAARYAAGLQSEVELEGGPSSAGSPARVAAAR